MKLLSLSLKNFRQHADTHVAFPETGITGIVGSNEAGKSTLLEAATWAIYGSRAIRGTMAGVRWHRAPARHVAEADLRFEVGGVRYRVWRNESNAKAWIDGQAEPVAEGTSAVDAYLPERIGMGLREFMATYACLQKDLSRLASMGATDRQVFVRGVMGLDRIDAALMAARERKNDLAREMEGLSAGLGDGEPLEAELAEAQTLVDRLEPETANARTALADRQTEEEAAAGIARDLDGKLERHRELLSDATAARRDVDRLEREVAEAEAEIAEGEAASGRLADAERRLARLPELRQRRDELLQARERVRQREQLQEAVDSLAAEASRLSAELEELDETIAAHDEDALRAVADRFREAEAKVGRLAGERERACGQAKAEGEAAAAAAEKVRRQVSTLEDTGADGPCPTCTRPLGEHLAEVLGTLRAAVAAHEEEAKAAARRALALVDPTEDEARARAEAADLRRRGEQLKEARTAASRAQERVGKVRQLIESNRSGLARRKEQLAEATAVPHDPVELDMAEARIRELEELERKEAAPDRARVQAAEQARARLEAARRQEAERRAEIERALVAAEELGYTADAHEAARAAAQATAARLAQAREDLARAEERLQAAEHRRDRAAHQMEEYCERAGRLGDLQEQLRIHAAAADRLNTFRVHQASLIRPELEELVTGFVSILTDGRHDSVTVTEDFAVVLQEGGIDAEVVSGGAEDITAIALRLAISQMIAERAGHPLSLLILDEPFGSLDQVRRGNVLNLIRRLSGTFEQVLVISHVDETRDAVDHVVELEYDEAAGRSRVVSAPAARERAPAEAEVVAA